MIRAGLFALAGVLIAQSAQAPAPDLDIVSPSADAYISGTTVLRATLSPADAAARVLFSVDGKQVCSAAAPPFECSWEAGPNVTAHQIRVVADLKAGGRVIKTVRTRALGYAEKVDVDIVQIIATVMDGSGHFVTGLPKTAFHIEEDGRPQAVSHFGAEDVPLELIVACDVSGSMAPAMPRLKQAVKEFLAAVPTRDQVTLIGFNDSIFALTRRASNPADRLKAVDRLAPWGATALYDVILRGIDMLGKQPGRRAMIVFSDGEDQGSHAAIADVERRLQASDVTLYMIGQGRGVEVDALKAIMQRLVEPTGGRALFTDNIDQLHLAFSDLLEELSNQYLLGYESTNAKRDENFRKISVRVDGQSHVRARQGYRAVAPK
ncbi:MAG TPA: VWA domain-containing protein [Vicinamibacterales bacterium]|nr:VWA domain-containing protein [Vicinamibacterales bacterium]